MLETWDIRECRMSFANSLTVVPVYKMIQYKMKIKINTCLCTLWIRSVRTYSENETLQTNQKPKHSEKKSWTKNKRQDTEVSFHSTLLLFKFCFLFLFRSYYSRRWFLFFFVSFHSLLLHTDLFLSNINLSSFHILHTKIHFNSINTINSFRIKPYNTFSYVYFLLFGVVEHILSLSLSISGLNLI